MNFFCFRWISIVSYILASTLFSTLVYATDVPVDKQEDLHKSALLNAKLPPLPADTHELLFNDFFKMPIGPQGLEPTEKLLSLNNKRVRIVGYMAREDDPTPGIFMLAARPVNVGEKADGMADDLPASTLFVHMPTKDAEKILTYRPAPWVLTGILQVGNQEDINGRISFVRLVMDSRDIEDAKKDTKGKKLRNKKKS